jgi:DNA-binding SARP family transcriptional activator/tetratricopeptide (TPR) repeat protein
MLPWRLFCLGQPALVGPDGEPVRLRTRKHMALLVYLAVEPSVPHRRDRLATLLWPRVAIEEGRHSLATALSMLRGRLGAEAFEATRDTIRLLPGRVVTDVAQLLVGDVLEGDVRPAPFLDEFDIPRANDFTTWIDAQRAALRPVLHAHLADRIVAARQAGDADRLEQLAARLRRIDPLSEHAARAAMEARAMAGDRIGALRDYDRWRGMLAEELGAVPSREVERIADRLRRRGLETSPRAPLAPVPTEQWQERVFVGRAEEHRLGYALWETVRRGQSRHLLVRAADGLGKTTLLARLGTSLALEGAAVARVQCYELERELPFGVIGSLVGQLLELPGASATPPDELAELGRVVGKVRQRWASLPPASEASGEEARLQFTEAVLALATAVAEEQPLVLLLDDIHLADATSLAVLHLLLRRMADLPVLALMSSGDDPGSEPAAIRRLAEHGDALGLTVLSLRPLGAAASAALLDQLLDGADDPGPSIRRAILAGARGVPMILELLVADWCRRGDASMALSLGAMTPAGEGPTPEAFAQLIAGTMASLDPATRAVADLAAILGQRLNDLGMYTLVDLPVARTMRAMSTLASRRVLRDAGSHLEFANEVVRAQCYAEMAAPMRRRLHAMVADRLMAEAGTAEAIGGLEVAWHLVRGDRLPEAVPHLLAGGRAAIRRGAPHEADLALSTGMPLLTGTHRRKATLLLAEALQELGRWPESLAVLDGAVEAWDTEERHQHEVLSVIGRRWSGGMRAEDLSIGTERLLAITHLSANAETRVRALSAAVRLLSLSQDGGQTKRVAIAAELVDLNSLDQYQRLHLLFVRAWSLAQQRDLSGALNLLNAAEALARDGGYLSSLVARVAIGVGNVSSQLGEYSAALRPLERALSITRGLDNGLLQAEALALLAMVSARLGRVQDQVSYARDALRLQQQRHWGPSSVGAGFELGMGLALTGCANEARDLANWLATGTGAATPVWEKQVALLNASDILWAAGIRKLAKATAQRALSCEVTELKAHAVGPYSRWLVRLSEGRGSLTAIESVVTGLYARLETLDRKDQAEVLAAAGCLAAGLGQDVRRYENELAIRLNSLPAGVTNYLRVSGFTPEHWRHCNRPKR